jgi:hypothetical protein
VRKECSKNKREFHFAANLLHYTKAKVGHLLILRADVGEKRMQQTKTKIDFLAKYCI